MKGPRMGILYFLAVVLLTALQQTAPPDAQRAVLVVSRDHHFDAKWNQTLSRSGVKLVSTSEVFRGERVYLRLFLIGAAVNEAGRADVVFDLSVTGPSGETMFSQNGLPGLEGIIDPRSVHVVRSTPVLEIEPDDPLGKWRVRVVVHDRVAEKRIEKETAFSVREFDRFAGLADDADLGKRLMTYYAQPNPAHGLAMLGLIDRATPGKKQRALAVQLSPFFRILLKDNPFLLGPFAEELKERGPKKRRPLLPIIKALVADHAGWVRGIDLNKTERAELDRLELPDIDGEIRTAEQLDMLWSAFFASGDIGPIRKIVGAIPLSKNDDVRLMLVGGAAIWSLGSNARRHELVREYCRFILESGEKMDGASRSALEEIVKDAASKP